MYREDFYKIHNRKRRNKFKGILFLLCAFLIVFGIVLVLRNRDDNEIVGIFIFNEQILQAPSDGIFRSKLADMEKIRIGQVVGYIENSSKENYSEISLLENKYKDILKNLDDIGEKINLYIDELRIKAFKGNFDEYNDIVKKIKQLSDMRKDYLNKLDNISKEIQKLNQEKFQNLVVSQKSGYIVFDVDNFVRREISLENLTINDLKKTKYANYLNKKVRKGEIIGVVRDFPPNSFVFFSKLPFEKGKYLVINCEDKFVIKVKVMEIEVLKNFYKINTLPIGVNNIILKERIIRGRVVKVL